MNKDEYKEAKKQIDIVFKEITQTISRLDYIHEIPLDYIYIGMLKAIVQELHIGFFTQDLIEKLTNAMYDIIKNQKSIENAREIIYKTKGFKSVKEAERFVTEKFKAFLEKIEDKYYN